MSDHLSVTLQKQKEEFKVTQKEESKNLYQAQPGQEMRNEEASGADALAVAEKVKKETEELGFTNKLSKAGEINLKRVEQNMDPILDTRYVNKEEG